jgi:hypothetical protein
MLTGTNPPLTRNHREKRPHPGLKARRPDSRCLIIEQVVYFEVSDFPEQLT